MRIQIEKIQIKTLLSYNEKQTPLCKTYLKALESGSNDNE